jgi:hypothetical protein
MAYIQEDSLDFLHKFRQYEILFDQKIFIMIRNCTFLEIIFDNFLGKCNIFDYITIPGINLYSNFHNIEANYSNLGGKFQPW